jgi:imidazolonepropionase-like amidohydrolase
MSSQVPCAAALFGARAKFGACGVYRFGHTVIISLLRAPKPIAGPEFWEGCTRHVIARRGLLLAAFVLALGQSWVSLPAAGQAPQPTGATVFEGARVIVGEGSSLDDAAFVVANGRFIAVGRRGQVAVPAGATRIDLAGKTVMPAIVDAHGHPGFLDAVTGKLSKANFTRENYIDHLERYAYQGVAATISTGTDMGDLVYRLREEMIPNAARILTVGRGLAYPGSGPFDPSRNDVPYAVTSVTEARKAVQDLAPRKPDFVKIWVDSRNGTQKKLTPEMFSAAADEARRQGLRSIAHVFDLADAKLLIRAGVEGFMHSVRDQEVDDEFVTLAKEHNIWITPNLGGINRASLIREDGTPAWFDEPLVRETIAPAPIRERAQLYEQRKSAAARQAPGGAGTARPAFDAINTRKLHAAGVMEVLGSDTAGDGNRWIGLHTLLEFDNMVAAGFTPMEAIVAATRDSAKVLGLDQLGTVAAGKSADFVVLGANPLDNISNVRNIDAVRLRGQEVDRAGLRAKWQAQWRGKGQL